MKILLKKIIKITLFTYSAVLAFALTFGAFSRGFNYSNIITALLFLPITYHFILEIKKGLRNATSIKDESLQETFYFSLKSFISQKDPSFAITIILLTISASITFLRATNVLPTATKTTTTTNYLGSPREPTPFAGQPLISLTASKAIPLSGTTN